MAQFPSTQWSLVRQSGTIETRRSAFAKLVQTYHSAILAFFSAHLGADAAQDAAQSFLTLSFERDWWARADASIGSFRGFLLVLLRRHLHHVGKRSPTTDLDVIGDLAGDDPSTDEQFDARFALELTSRAVDAQRLRYGERGRERLFERLLPLLTSPPDHGELKAVAAELQIPANTLIVESKRLRQRLREELRRQLEDLCADEAVLAAEWAALQRILGGRG
jgi:hypothetical protein